MLVTDIDEFNKAQIKTIREAYGGDVLLVSGIEEECAWEEAEVLVTFGDIVDVPFLNKCPNLRWIQVMQSGVEKLPLQEIERRGITLTNILGIHSIPMAEYVISYILYFSRGMGRFIENQKKHVWDRDQWVEEAYGKTVGITGAGTIGQDIAAKLKLLGLTVYGLNTKGEMKPHFDRMYATKDKQQLLEQCDYLVLLLPLTEETRNFIGAKELQQMKKDACLINIGRGPLIDTAAFIEAMKRKEIKGAVLDVFDQEPLEEDSELWDLENVLITPHLAAKSVMYIPRCIEKFTENMLCYKEGKPLNFEINMKRGY